MSTVTQAQFDKVLTDRNHADYNCYLWMVNNRHIIEAGIEATRKMDNLDSEEVEEMQEDVRDLLESRATLNDALINMLQMTEMPMAVKEEN